MKPLVEHKHQMRYPTSESSRQPTALITGSAVRLGKQIAMALSQAGYRVAIHYNKSRDQAQQTVSEIINSGGTACAFEGDFSQPVSTAASLCQSVRNEWGSLDLLVNNASLFEAGTLLEATEGAWNRLLAVNLQAPFFLSQSYFKGLSPDQSGHIINICDWRGERFPSGHDIYTLTKSGLVAMTKMLAQELAPRVRVNGIHPGAILPPLGAEEDHQIRAQESIPLRHPGESDDIVRGVLYLIESPFVTGEILNITGGEHLT